MLRKLLSSEPFFRLIFILGILFFLSLSFAEGNGAVLAGGNSLKADGVQADVSIGQSFTGKVSGGGFSLSAGVQSAQIIITEVLPPDTVPTDTVPEDTIPTDTIPTDTVPEDTIPQDTLPLDTGRVDFVHNIPQNINVDMTQQNGIIYIHSDRRLSLLLVNASGKKLLKGLVEGEYLVNMNNYAAGSYYLKLFNQQQTRVFRLTK
jgi:hypothetical protein